MTTVAALKLVEVFRSLRDRGEPRDRAQRFILQCAVDLLAGGLAPAPRHGFFTPAEPIELTPYERTLLAAAAGEDRSAIHLGILGALFQATMSEGARHEHGAHYTPEDAILEHVVRPSLVEPWRARIHAAATVEELLDVHAALTRLRVLDPACGSGNFLHVAYRALQGLEGELCARLPTDVRVSETVTVTQLFGIDRDPFAVELARVTLMLAARPALPALDANLRCDDALFCDWPAADLIVGNPPFQSKNKMPHELGAAYVRRLRDRYPDVPGRADYCVYWFRRAHDALTPGARAGLVGTNTIRQNDSREGGLDHIVGRGGTITEAVATMVWPGEAAVHVSVVSWIKGEHAGPKRLSWQEGDVVDSPWTEIALDRIPASLSASLDVTSARPLAVNVRAGACYQGQTHGHEGFLLSAAEARAMCAASPRNAEVIFPYLTGDDLLTEPGGRPTRWVIDFHPRSEHEARRYEEPFRRVEQRVLPGRSEAATSERARNAELTRGGNRHHQSFLRRFWLLGYPRGELVAKLATLSRYIACSRVTKRPIFAFVSTSIRPSDALAVFPLQDDYSFGILQSGLHGAWFEARGSSLKRDRRYTSSTVFDSFPWPQAPATEHLTAVAEAAVALRGLRARCGEPSLRALYATLESAGRHPLQDAHAALDDAVRAAYGMGATEEPLRFLLDLDHACAAREARGLPVVGPGLPPRVTTGRTYTTDAIQPTML